MHLDLTLLNYRCFPDSNPARLSIRSGVTALVGANNSGKSTLLKFFYEFRGLFDSVLNTNALAGALGGRAQPFNVASTVRDQREVFYDGNQRDLGIHIALPAAAVDLEGDIPAAKQLAITVLPLSANMR